MELNSFQNIYKQALTQLYIDWSTNGYIMSKVSKNIGSGFGADTYISNFTTDKIPAMYRKRSSSINPEAICGILSTNDEILLSAYRDKRVIRDAFKTIRNLNGIKNSLALEYPGTIQTAGDFGDYEIISNSQSICFIPSIPELKQHVLQNKYILRKLRNDEVERISHDKNYTNIIGNHSEKVIIAYAVYMKFPKNNTEKMIPVAICIALTESMFTTSIKFNTLDEYRGKGLQRALMPLVINDCIEMELVPVIKIEWSNISALQLLLQCDCTPAWSEIIYIKHK